MTISTLRYRPRVLANTRPSPMFLHMTDQAASKYSFSAPGGSTANCTAANLGNGTSLGWVAGQTMASGQYTGIKRTGLTLNLSAYSEVAIELGYDNNDVPTRVQIIFGDVNNVNSSQAVVSNGNRKRGLCRYVIKKSEFTTLSGTGAPWNAVKEFHVRVTGNATVPSPSYALNVRFYGVTWGINTKPTLLISADDGNEAFYQLAFAKVGRIKDLKIPGVLFLNNNPLTSPGPGGTDGSMTLAHIQEIHAAGWDVCPHNWNHRCFAVNYQSMTVSGDQATIVCPSGIFAGSNLGNLDASVFAAGKYITIEDCAIREWNGSYPIVSTSAPNIVISGVTGKPTISAWDGGYLLFNAYDWLTDFKANHDLIRSMGLDSGATYRMMASTFGALAKSQRARLSSLGWQICRGTTGTDDTNAANQYVTPMFALQGSIFDSASAITELNTFSCSASTTANNLTAFIDTIIDRGGLGSIYFHRWNDGGTYNSPDLAEAAGATFLAYAASKRAAGQLEIVNGSQLLQAIDLG